MTKNPTPIIIHSAEEVFDFLQDVNDQRMQEIRIEDLVNHISRSTQLNFN